MPLLPIWTKLTSQMSIMGWTVTENENIVNKKCQKRRINIHWEPRTVNPGASVKWPLVAQREKSQGLDRRRKGIGPFGSCKLWKGRGGTMEANYQKLLWPKVISGLNLPLLVLTAALFKEAGGHGRLRHPAGRSTMWRWESSTFLDLVCKVKVTFERIYYCKVLFGKVTFSMLLFQCYFCKVRLCNARECERPWAQLWRFRKAARQQWWVWSRSNK